MQINSIDQQPNFKQIKFSEAEFKNAQEKYKYMLNNLKNTHDNYRLFDIFEQHLNKEVDLKQYKTGKERKYFSTNLYIKFFEILESTKTKNLPFESLIKNLNNYIDKFNIKQTPETDYAKLQGYNVSCAKTTARHFREYLGLSKAEFLKMAQKIPFFQNTSLPYLKLQTENLIKTLGFTEEECIEIYKKNPVAMIHSSYTMISRANNIMKTLNIKDSEELKNVLKNNTYLLTFDEFNDSIKNITEFLDTDENNVKMMIKTQPYIATMKMEHFKKNFFAMKDYIKVNRDKMVEIAIMAPTTVAVPFETSKKKYEDISKILGILPETFYNKAYSITALYRMTIPKLEKYIDFISTKFGYTNEEAAKYIGKHLNILSYRYNNMIERSENNYKILNQKLDIDYDTFIYMLEENPWIMGHKEDYIEKQIRDIKDYFNIDKATQKRMFENNPQLVTYFVENIDKDISDASEYFNIDKEEFKQMCTVEPLLATRLIKHHQADAPEIAEILNMTRDEFVEFAKKHPEYLAYDPEQVVELKKEVIKT